MTPQRVQVFSLGLPKKGTSKDERRYIVRWRIDGRDKKRRLKTKAEADRLRSQLIAAVTDGERFDMASGFPLSWQQTAETWWSWSRQWIGLKWPRWAGSSRKSGVEAMVAITPHLVRPKAPSPPPELRSWLWAVGFDPTQSIGRGVESAWLDRWSVPLDQIEPGLLEIGLTAATTRLDGQPNGANVAKRRRDLVNSTLKAAVRRRILDANPMERVEWSPPLKSDQVDVSLLPAMSDVDELVAHIAALKTPGARYAAFFATIAYAGLRPSEAAALEVKDIDLPANGWGKVHLRGATPSPGARYTDTESTRESKSLKHRAAGSVRRVPLAPQLVVIVQRHLDRWPVAGGLVFTSAAGRSVTPENYGKVWNREKSKVWPVHHVASGTVPYDLRHTAATTMLRAGVPLPEVARRLGHSVEVLLRVYAGVFADEEDRSNDAIQRELERQQHRGHAPQEASAQEMG